MEAFLALAFALLFGLFITRITSKFHLPDVTAYLIAGVLCGPYCIGLLGIPGVGFLSTDMVKSFSFVSQAALGFIAFDIGSEFRLSQLKKTGKQATVIGILQAIVTAVIVDLFLVLLHLVLGEKLSVPAAITLGAIASATAPAATLMVVHQYKAKGKVTDVLLPVVALDDAVGLAIFSVSFGIAKALTGGSVDLFTILINPMIEIVGSLLLGAIIGFALTFAERFFHSHRNRLSLIIGAVLITVGLSMLEIQIGPAEIGFSSLLVCMMLGTVFCNECPLSEELMSNAQRWTAPLLTLFFVINGAELELSVFTEVAVIGIGVVYILSRCLGKYVGAFTSCKLVHAAPEVTKYLGITLFPQAGVALGMCVTAGQLPECGSLIRNIILFSVLIYELIGPVLTKIALTKAGDIQTIPDEVKNRRQMKLEAVKANGPDTRAIKKLR